MLTQSCSKDNNCGDTSDVINNYIIEDSNKAKMPYTGTDTLVFISDKGDTATLIGQGKKTYYIIKKTNISGGDCEKNEINNYERVEYNFSGIDTTIKAMQIIINSTEKYLNENFIQIFINGSKYSDYSTLQHLYSNKIPDDSISIFSGYQYGITMGNKIILFNFKQGILKIKDFLNEKNWILYFKK